MKAVIIVTPKPSVFDPQGEAVCRAVHSLGLKNVSGVRIGKYIEVEIEGKTSVALRKRLETVSHDLLSNPVIEDYKLQIGAPARRPATPPRRTLKKTVAKPSRPTSSVKKAPTPAAVPNDWHPGDEKKKKAKKAEKAEKKKAKKKGKKKDKN